VLPSNLSFSIDIENLSGILITSLFIESGFIRLMYSCLDYYVATGVKLLVKRVGVVGDSMTFIDIEHGSEVIATTKLRHTSIINT